MQICSAQIVGGFVGKLLVLIWVTFTICSASAAQLFFFDYDGTILLPKKSDKNALGIYDTKVKLFKIHNRPNLLVNLPDGPEVIEVSASDIKHKLTRINEVTEEEESILSPKDGRIGSLEKVTLSDGSTIVPGLYRIMIPESFEYYRESPEGRNYLLEDFKLAEQLEAKKIGTFKGPFWSHMVNLLSDETSAKQFGLITARGHSSREWKELFDYLLERGYIKYLPDLKNIHNINRPEYEKYGMGDSDTIRKVELLKDIALNLSKKRNTNDDYRLHPNGKDAGFYHSLSFVDDNQKTLQLAYQELRHFATKRMKVKFILSNSGLDHEVKKSRKPRSFVITGDGVARPATDFEIYGEPAHQNQNRFLGAKDSKKLNEGLKSCAMIFN